MIPFNPEPLDRLKTRFTQALIESYNVVRILEDANLRPGNKPQHVFDSEDGIRLIISRDRLDGKEVIHFSASIDPKVFKGKLDRSLFVAMRNRFSHISGSTKSPTFVRFSEEGIPHWIIEFSNLN